MLNNAITYKKNRKSDKNRAESRMCIINPDYALEMHKRLTSCKSICMAKLITTVIPKFLREG